MIADLENMTALITGAGRNIGRAIALAMADAGADVSIIVKSSLSEAEAVAQEIVERGRKAIVITGDIGNIDDVDRIVRETIKNLGTINILVNNAAIRPFQPFLSITPGDWESVIRTNLYGAFYLSRLTIPSMIEYGFGRIINISGVDSFSPLPNRAHNLASKSALAGLTKALALEFGSKGITANMVVPGAINTTRKQAHYGWFSAFKNRIEKENPVPRLGNPFDIAYATVFLASPHSSYINGQSIHVNGGMFMG